MNGFSDIFMPAIITHCKTMADHSLWRSHHSIGIMATVNFAILVIAEELALWIV